MEILKKYPVFILFVFVLLCSCRKDELNDLPVNPFEKNSGVEIITVDSLVTSDQFSSSPFVKGYFHIRYDLVSDTSDISHVIVNEKWGSFDHSISLHSNQRTYFIDINVSANTTFYISLAIQSKTRGISKFTPGYLIHVP